MPILVVYSCFPAVVHLLLWRLMSFDISSLRPCNERDRETDREIWRQIQRDRDTDRDAGRGEKEREREK